MDRSGLSGLAGTFLGEIGDGALELLLDDARIIEVARGKRLFAVDGEDGLGVVIEGTARAFLSDASQRQLTLRYVGPLGVVATSSSADQIRAVPIDVEAVGNVCFLQLNLPQLQRLMATHTSVALAVATEMSRRLTEVFRTFSTTFFGSLSERLAAHIFYAADPEASGRPVAQMTQYELATALGTAREVVARSLRRLERDGLIELKRGFITVPRPAALAAAAGPWMLAGRLFPTDASFRAETMDNLPQPVIGVDAAGDIVYANAAAERTFGWPSRTIIGRGLDALLTPVAPRPNDSRSGRRTPLTDETGLAGLVAAYRGRRSDGAEFPAEVTVLPTRTGDGRLIVATVVDVSYRARLRELVAGR